MSRRTIDKRVVAGAALSAVIPAVAALVWSRLRHGASGRTKAQLYREAQRAGIKGRSRMTKAQLERALS